ncbi:pilus assembly protein TadG-related protein [Endozoicomonas sp.]|uniref:pilus assembly protein TadG-related protein n=1 Tax=Endozoicomonas sp. TaxID=1892382 RepID=UPI003AF8185F
MVVLFGFLALALDVGLMMWRKSQFQTAVDAAALSAAYCAFMDPDQGQEEDSEQEQNKRISACGNDTLRYNLKAMGLDESAERSYDLKNIERDYLDVTVTSADMNTFFAGVLGEHLDMFSVTVSACAGVTGSPNKMLPLVVDTWDLFTSQFWGWWFGWFGQYPTDYIPTSVRAKVLLNPAGENLPEKRQLFEWLARDVNKSGGSEDSWEVEFYQMYDVYDPYFYLLWDQRNSYREPIRKGLNTRFECQNFDVKTGECNSKSNTYRYPFDTYPMDSYSKPLYSWWAYVDYFEKTASCNVNHDEGCWGSEQKPPADKHPQPYRRVFMAGIGSKYLFKPKARVYTTGCFAIFDDENDWYGINNRIDEIRLQYIPKGSQYADDYCNYGETSGPIKLVLMEQK